MSKRTGSKAPGADLVFTDLPAAIGASVPGYGRYRLIDVDGVSRMGSQAFVPVATLKDGVVHQPSTGPHPWGFEPPSVN